MRRIAALSAAVLLAACQPQSPDGAPAEPPADAPPIDAPPVAVEPAATASDPTNDFERDLNLVGTEPFWAVQVRATTMKLLRPDEPDLLIAKPDPAVENGQAVWKGAGLTVRLAARGPCSDGMSDRVYPFTAQIEVGGEVMKGCGARADAVFPPA